MIPHVTGRMACALTRRCSGRPGAISSERQARSVAVHSSGIIEGLRVVYKAEGLVREILGN